MNRQVGLPPFRPAESVQVVPGRVIVHRPRRPRPLFHVRFIIDDAFRDSPVEVRNHIHEIIPGYAFGPAYFDEYVFQDELKLRFFRGLAHEVSLLVAMSGPVFLSKPFPSERNPVLKPATGLLFRPPSAEQSCPYIVESD